jgi:cyclase
MLRTRVMPCLLLRNRGLVKTVKFKNATYVGDPINTVRIYNQMEVDELIFLDITATRESKEPQFKLINEIATECFMPFAYGGGIRTVDDIAKAHQLGAEKVAINTCANEKPELITEAARRFGSQAVIVSMDVKKKLFGRYSVYTHGGTHNTGVDPVTYAKRAEENGAGEILLTSIDQDGTFDGYDTELISEVAHAVGIPVIACGGAGKAEDFGAAVRAGASAVAAGSMVVFQGRNRSVLINFPSREELQAVLP